MALCIEHSHCIHTPVALFIGHSLTRCTRSHAACTHSITRTLFVAQELDEQELDEQELDEQELDEQELDAQELDAQELDGLDRVKEYAEAGGSHFLNRCSSVHQCCALTVLCTHSAVLSSNMCSQASL